jgi:hypothetical protein
MAVNDIIQIKLACRKDDQLGLMIRQFVVTAEVTGGATLTEIASAISTGAAPQIKALMSDEAVYLGAMAQRIFPLPIGAEVGVTDGAGAGTVTGGALPTQVSGLISLRTALAGPSQRARMYVPFPGEDVNTTEGIPDSTYVATLSLLGALFIGEDTVVGATGSTDLGGVVWHRATSTYDALVARFARSRWATQRRRGGFGAANPIIIIE